MTSTSALIRCVVLKREQVESFDVYPFSIPAVRELHELELDPRVTLFAGENGSGKSTLIEAIAVAAGFNPEGGSRHMTVSTRPSHSDLHRYLTLVRAPRRPRTGYFLRAESFFNVATYVESVTDAVVSHGGRSLHEQSHGESFLALVAHRFGPNGLYILDEPEAALSVQGVLTLMRRIFELVREGSQFIISTHSPILLGYPEAKIYELSDRGLTPSSYEETEVLKVTTSFLKDRDAFFRHLFRE